MPPALQDLDVRMNALMRPSFGLVDLADAQLSLPADLLAVAADGFERCGDRLYLRTFSAARRLTAETLDRWSAERWVNDVGLNSSADPSDPRWRPQLLGWGVFLGRLLLNDARDLVGATPIQVSIGLQSAEGKQDPQADYAVGALHVYTVGAPDDDLGSRVDDFEQPILTLTTPAPDPSSAARVAADAVESVFGVGELAISGMDVVLRRVRGGAGGIAEAEAARLVAERYEVIAFDLRDAREQEGDLNGGAAYHEAFRRARAASALWAALSGDPRRAAYEAAHAQRSR